MTADAGVHPRDTPGAEAIVIGSGPNGLAAAITLTRAGLSVTVLEAADTAGGGMRSAELTRPGFVHDVCSAVHPLAAGSPFFRSIPLADHGLELMHPELALTHPLGGDRVGVLHRSLDTTAGALGHDGGAWWRLFHPHVRHWDRLDEGLLGPLVRVPRHPFALARFGVDAVRSAEGLAKRFDTDEARGLIAGIAAHGFLPLDAPLTASFALVLGGLAHVHGWPVVKGGSQRLADAMAGYFESLGGKIVTGCRVRSLDELPPHRVVVADITPTQLVAMAGDQLDGFAGRPYRRFRHGPGVCKVDYALDGPVPWADPYSARAGTVHVGGTFEEVAHAEATVAAGHHAHSPFVLAAQQSVVDPSRAPEGQQTLWAYCHVPNGSAVDVSESISAQIERFAPGFRDRILDQHVMTAVDYETYNPSFVGGDISAGSHRGRRLLLRPRPALDPYATPIDGLFLCSASTPPGGGVHGMCGLHAAESVLRHLA